jgi:short-subunit dehydrogenase
MRGAASGRIINIGSLGGLTAMPFGAFYSATKFALEGYSEALWHEVRPLGIAVSLIEPGFVRTGIAHASRAAARLLAAYEGPRTRALAVVARAVEHGMAPDTVAAVVLRAAESVTPQLRYRVGPDARWLPLVRQAAPWSIYASGVRRKFALDGSR